MGERLRRILPTWAGREAVIVLIARVLMSSGRALASVVTPLYLAVLGYSAVRLGALFFAVAAVSTVLTTAVGVASDRVGRKVFLVVVPVATSLAAVVFAITTNDTAIFVAAALGSFGRGAGAGAGSVGPYQPAEAAYATDMVPPIHRNSLFSLLAFAASLGALVGSLLAGLAGETPPDAGVALAQYRPVFVLMAVLTAAAGVIAIWLHEVPPEPVPKEHRTFLPRRSMHVLVRLWITNGLNGLAVGMFGPFITYWFFRRYGAGPASIGALFAVINVATILPTLGAAPLARRLGIIRATLIVRLVQAGLLIPMVLAPTFLTAGAIYLVRMIAQRVGLPLRQSYTMAMAHPEERARVSALARTPAQGTSAASPLVAGYLFDQLSLSMPFIVAGILQIANALLYHAFFRKLAPEDEIAQGP